MRVCVCVCGLLLISELFSVSIVCNYCYYFSELSPLQHHIEAQDHHYVQADEKARQDLILSETMIIMIIRIVTTLLIQFMFFYGKKSRHVA